MRWDELRLDGGDASAPVASTLPLLPRGAVTRTFDTPEFRGLTFHEVTCRSALNKVPDASRMPFRWTINPYRGCTMACNFCFARKTHEYLDLDSGTDFETQIVVKTNVGEVLRRELRRPSWRGEHVAMGTNVDCYQRAEGRYRLMRDVIPALTEVANPFSILTKGALILRDLDLLQRAAEVTDVSAALSIGVGRPRAAPGRRARCAASGATARGRPPADRRRHPDRRADGTGPPVPQRLRRAARRDGVRDRGHRRDVHLADRPAPAPGAREWWTAWLRRHHPELVVPLRPALPRRRYADSEYQDDVTARIRALAARHGVGRTSPQRWRTGHERGHVETATEQAAPAAAQLSLL